MKGPLCRLSLALLASGIIASPAHAQNWFAGVKGGIGQGGYTDSSEFNWNHIGAGEGVFLNHAIGGRFGFQPEITHLTKQGISRVGGSTLTLDVSYLEIPLLAQFKLLSADGLTPYVIAGPNVAISLSCKLKFAGGGLSTVDDCNSGNGTVRSRRFDFGATGGAGISWPVGIAVMNLEGRASIGNRSLVSPVAATNTRSFGWSVMAGFALPLSVPRILQVPPAQRPFPTTPAPHPGEVAIASQLPPLSSQTIVDRVPQAESAVPAGKRITLNAVDADARSLILTIAKEADLNIVVSSDVKSRVTIAIKDVPAMEAIESVIEAAGLQLSTTTKSAMLPAVVFYQIPLDVNKASADAIVARFGVSREMADFIVASREKLTP